MSLMEIMKKRKELEAVDKQVKREKDKEELANNIASKIRTSFIGALAAFEAEFGYVWGHGQLRPTESQIALKEKWAKVRKEILDKGNDQIKFARNEIAKYEAEKVGVRTEIDVYDYLHSTMFGGQNG